MPIIKLQDQVTNSIHRIPVELDFNFASLEQYCRQSFGQAEYILHYFSGGDQCRISNDMELSAFLQDLPITDGPAMQDLVVYVEAQPVPEEPQPQESAAVAEHRRAAGEGAFAVTPVRRGDQIGYEIQNAHGQFGHLINGVYMPDADHPGRFFGPEERGDHQPCSFRQEGNHSIFLDFHSKGWAVRHVQHKPLASGYPWCYAFCPIEGYGPSVPNEAPPSRWKINTHNLPTDVSGTVAATFNFVDAYQAPPPVTEVSLKVNVEHRTCSMASRSCKSILSSETKDFDETMHHVKGSGGLCKLKVLELKADFDNRSVTKVEKYDKFHCQVEQQQTFQPGRVQVFRNVKTKVSVGQEWWQLEEEVYVQDVPQDSVVNLDELSRAFIIDHFGDVPVGCRTARGKGIELRSTQRGGHVAAV